MASSPSSPAHVRRLASQLHQLSAAPAASADGQQPAAYFDADEPLPEFITTDQTSCGLEYTATVGFLPIVLDETDGVVGKMFFVYYAKKGEPEDLDTVGEFIRLFLTRLGRWSSPVYIAGESYGTTRAAGLSAHLLDRAGIALQGVVLISSVLNFQTLWDPISGNELPSSLFVPTYAATAWYHQKLPDQLQKLPLPAFLKQVEAWVDGEYAMAQAAGERLPAAERTAIGRQLAEYTGVSELFVQQSNLRIDDGQYRKELLRADRRTVGRLDSRYVGIDRTASGSSSEFDPANSAATPAFAACFNNYIRTELGFETDANYYILGGFPGFEWNYPTNAFGDTSEDLRRAMASNPHMKVLITSGYYDMATPYWATEYTFAHMDIEPELKENVAVTYYEAGHMMYLVESELIKLHGDLNAFYDSLVGKEMPRAVANVPGRPPAP